MQRTIIAALTLALLALACGSPKSPATLTLTATPNSIDGLGQVSTIGVSATDEYGKAGTGKVTLSSMGGTLTTPMITLDSNGYGETPFHCEVASDPLCTGSVQLKGSWAHLNDTVITYGHVQVGSGGGGSGGGSGTGGGAGGGLGSLCTTGQTPGLTGKCCSMTGTDGPPCAFRQVVDSEIVMAPFVPASGSGTQIVLPFEFSVPTLNGILTDCGLPYGYQVDLSSDGGFKNISSHCQTGIVAPDGQWVELENGNCNSTSFFINVVCPRLHGNEDAGVFDLGAYFIVQPVPGGLITVNNVSYTAFLGPNNSLNGYWGVVK